MKEQQCEMHEALMAEFANADKIKVESGHPIDIMQRENDALINLYNELQGNLSADDIESVISNLNKLMSISSHYGKKEELFMPILYQHGVTGPYQVMWAVDDDIKLEIRNINKNISSDTYSKLKNKIVNVIQDMRDMIDKEEIVFFPISLKFFTQDEWLKIYRDMSDFDYTLITDIPKWSKGEDWIKEQETQFKEKFLDGKIQYDTGEITIKQLQGILKLLPVDITFIDVEGNVRFFVNEGATFARPKSILGRSVMLCHPPKVVPIIEKLFEDFKAKKRKRMEVWKYVKGKPVAIKYLAVYDEADEYIGTVELVEDFSEALKQFANK